MQSLKEFLVLATLAGLCINLSLGDPDAEDEKDEVAKFKESLEQNTKLKDEKKREILRHLETFEDERNSRDTSATLGQHPANKHFQAEVDLLGAYHDAGLPLDTGFGQWLKQDLDSQLDVAYGKLHRQTGLSENKKKSRQQVLDQLSYDLVNLGVAINTKKMEDHAKWLDNYETMTTPPHGHGVLESGKHLLSVGADMVRSGTGRLLSGASIVKESVTSRIKKSGKH